ncbi:MAG: preprotein translocase subunit YajC [Clostridia bacterium]|nr:preprotein translocase subunit YajC [Clostridia bacterium]
MFSLTTTAYATAAAGQAAGPAGLIGSFLPLILMVLVFYFILLRPQKKREKELKNMLASLKVNDEVATIGGIHGKITRIKDDLFVLESGIGQNKSYITVDRSAISRFIKRGEEEKVAPEIAENATEE